MNRGAAIGRTADRDFLAFADSVSKLEGGVYLSVGSAVMSPMIFEKALSMSRNAAHARGGAIEDFALTYGDGLSDVDLDAEFAFHKRHGRLGTILGVQMLARFGELGYGADGVVSSFLEKPESKQGLINGGFFFFRRDFRRYLDAGPDCVLELAPLAKLVADNQLMLYPHRGFWQPMDTLRDRTLLQGLWDSGRAPWKVEPAT
jgi:NDP-sugar pyrophosphorylase family protein